MTNRKIIAFKKPGEISEDPLTELLRSGARQLIANAVEAELDDDGSSTESTQTSATSNVSESNSDSSDSVSTSEQVSSSAGSNADTSAASSSGESASGSGSDDQIYPDQKSGCACRSVPRRGGWWGTALLSGVVLSIRGRRRHVKTRRTIAQRV